MPLMKYAPKALVNGEEAVASPEESAPVATKPDAPKYTGGRKTDDTMSKAEWAAKDRRISRAGLYQAALQSPGLMQFCPTLEDYWALVKKTAELGLEFVNAEADK